VETTVQKFMEEPITLVEALFKGRGKDELNAKGKAFCGQFRTLMAKYPFNPKATVQATLPEVNAVFRKPDGALWTLYEGNLQKLLPKQGTQYVSVPAGEVSLTPAFVNFFNLAAGFSEAAYPKDAQDPRIPYSLKWIPTEGVQGISVKLDGQAFTATTAKSDPAQLVWPGSGAHGADVRPRISGSEFGWVNREGIWGVYQFFADAEQWQHQGNVDILDWVVRSGNDAFKLDGKPVTIRFQLDMAGSPPVFQKGYFSRLACVAEIAK
jgi:type VI protein secretion system component VasK